MKRLLLNSLFCCMMSGQIFSVAPREVQFSLPGRVIATAILLSPLAVSATLVGGFSLLTLYHLGGIMSAVVNKK